MALDPFQKIFLTGVTGKAAQVGKLYTGIKNQFP